MPQLIFDPHVHFIDLRKGHYHWLRNANECWLKNVNKIKKNFYAEDLTLFPPFELEGFTHVEAGFDNTYPERELSFVSNVSKKASLISYLALDTPPTLFEQKLSLFMLFQQFIGIRDISEGEDFRRLEVDSVVTNLTLLEKCQLIFEVQFNLDDHNALKLFETFARKLPNLKIVINHCGFVSPNNYESWSHGIKKLSQCKNIYIKFCGFEMLSQSVTSEFKQEVLDTLLDSFSESRVMFASNFPLCLTQKSYQQVWQEYSEMQLTPEVWRKLSYENAKRVYLT
ncbi:hypothetical protein SOPP22_17040 [Shewanella sp. OPT22]|nr:hypothetical protein SOPP22_17040 [Shewanella sp. OPT22]